MSTQPLTQSDMDQLRAVAAAEQRVLRNEGSPSVCRTAQQMLRLMGGDAGVIEELPTLRPPVRRTAKDAAVLGEDLLGEELSKETSVESVQESKGLLGLTVANIRDIKTYVKKSLGLKTTEAEVALVLGYNAGAPFCAAHPEFAPAKFAEFYIPFNAHAGLWAGIETEIIAQGNGIQVYGNSFASHADFVLKIVEKMDLFSAVEDAELTDMDTKLQGRLGDILDKWQQETLKHQQSTTALLGRLTSFQNTLVNTLQPSANNMIALLGKLDLADETKRLKQEIDELTAQIDTKQKEYDKNCGLAFTGAAGLVLGPLGVISWAVTGGVFGAKAEKARKERNELQEKRSQKQTLYNSLNAVADNVHTVTDGISDLGIAVTNAVTGLRSLSAVWNLITQFITAAKDSLMEVNAKSDLLDFMFKVTDARDSWKEVPSIAAGLLDLFRQADTICTLEADFTAAMNETDRLTAAPYRFDAAVWDDKFAALIHVVLKPASTVMPVLKTKAAELKNHAVSIDDAVRKALPATEVQAVRVRSAANLPGFEECARQLKENPSDERALALSERLAENLRKAARTFDKSLHDVETLIKDNAKVLKDNTRTDLSETGFYAQLNTQCKRFDFTIQQHTKLMLQNFIEPMNALKEEMKSLDANIDQKLDPESVMRDFKEFLPSEAEVSSMITQGATSQEAATVEGIKLVYSTVLKGFDVIGSTLKLCKDITKASKLSDRLSALRAQYDEAYLQMQALLDNQAELNHLLHLHGILAFYVESGHAEADWINATRTSLIQYVNPVVVDPQGCHQIISDFIKALNDRYAD